MMKTVAIVGRANVGKSTLFNRLVGERKAITSDSPGTTRDRVYGQVTWNGQNFILIDTAGLEPNLSVDFNVVEQINLAITEADLIVFIVDVKSGLTERDSVVLKHILKSKRLYILVVNKYDSEKYFSNLQEFYRLGVKELMPVSALNGRGTGDLLDMIVKKCRRIKAQGKENLNLPGIRTAIVGRPNVGKSSLLNQILGQNRALVSEKAGTTRDINVAEAKKDGKIISFVDTAGIRKRGRVGKSDKGRAIGQIEKYSVIRALKAIEKSDVVLSLVDASEGLTAQDLHIIGFALDNLKSVILVVNKWDLSEEEMVDYLHHLQNEASFISYAPVIFVSAKTGKNVAKIINLIVKVAEARNKRVSTNELNIILKQDILKKAPPAKKGILPKITYMTQADKNPPTFIFFTNHPELIHFSYVRYLENRIREHWDFSGTPINLIFKKKNE